MNTDTATCGEVRRHGNTTFVCVAPPHQNHMMADQHVFSPRGASVGSTGGYPSNRHLESSLEEYFQGQVKTAGGMAIKLAPMKAGIPDRMVVIFGKIYLVELKAEHGSLSAIQLHRHGQLRERGVDVVVLIGRKEVREWVRDLVNDAGPRFRERKPKA